MKKIVGGALFRDGKLLIVKRTKNRPFLPGAWEIPGGHVEEGETEEDALIREFLEETGINIKIVTRYHEMSYDYAGEPAEEHDYIVTGVADDVKLDPKEHSKYDWMTKGKVKKLYTSPGMKECMERAFEVYGSRKRSGDLST